MWMVFCHFLLVAFLASTSLYLIGCLINICLKLEVHFLSVSLTGEAWGGGMRDALLGFAFFCLLNPDFDQLSQLFRFYDT